MSRQSTKNKKYALRKIGKVFGSCVVATVITLGGVAIMAPNVTVYASDTSSDEEPNIGELSSATEGYQVFVPKGKKYVRNDDVDYDPNAQPKLITEGHNGNSFILKAKPNKNLTEEEITDHFEEEGNELENLFKKLYDDDGDGKVDPKYKRADADAINANAGQPLENDPNFVEPKVSEIDPKYPHRLDSGIYTPDKDDSNHDGKPDGASGEIDSDDSVVESNKPLTVNPDAEENVVTEDGNVVLSKYYRIHVNEGEDADKVDDVYEIGTKPKEEVETTPKTTRYVGDSDTPYNTKVTSVDGHDGSVTKKTTYELNENTGEVTPKETVTIVEKEDKVVKVGNKEVTTEKIAITTHYTADPRLEKDRQETDNNGTEGTREITKVYEVSPTTGDLSNPTRTENVTVAMVPKEVRVGNVEKEVVETKITTRYIPDETKDRDKQEVVTPGSKGVRTITTTYSVDPNTGATHTPVVTEDDKPMEQKVVKVGIKPVETTEIIDITTKYIQDPDLDYGKTVIDNPGSEGQLILSMNKMEQLLKMNQLFKKQKWFKKLFVLE